MDEVTREFLVESFEGLDQTDQDLVALERDPNSREILANIFRTVHTIKGTASLLGFTKLVGVTHVGENLLSLLRAGKRQLSQPITNGLLAMVDAVREMLTSIENSDNDGEGDYSGLISLLTRLLEDSSASEELGSSEPVSELSQDRESKPAGDATKNDLQFHEYAKTAALSSDSVEAAIEGSVGKSQKDASDSEEPDEVLTEFLSESREAFGKINEHFKHLDAEPGAHDVVGEVYRSINIIKGTAGLLNLHKIVAVTAAGDNLLAKLREGALKFNPSIRDALQRMVEAVREMLSNVETDGVEGDTDYTPLIAELTRLLDPAAAPAEPATTFVPPPLSQRSTDSTLSGLRSSLGKAFASASEIDSDNQQSIIAASDSGEAGTILRPGDSGRTAAAGSGAHALSESTIRVDVDLLDVLMNMMGELVLARNRVLQLTDKIDNSDFLSTSQHLNLVTSDLQERFMKIRMQPIGNIWNKFPRIVRDLAVSCGKEVRVEMEGRETELDKSLIEMIRDPLTHLVRNSVDHGIESPAVREAAGKPAEGRLYLRAFHEGGQVNIEITDDGGGIDADRIRDIAIQRQLISEIQAETLSERDLLQLMFLPGFSTVDSVTEVSGRGVGMDVVKTNIEKIGGTIDVETTRGVGTSFKLRIPLTLAIIPALIVKCDGDRYAIPQVSLHELVRLKGEQLGEGIETIHQAPVYRLRGNLIPLIFLRDQLGLEHIDHVADNATLHIVVLEANGRQFGLVVDEVSDSQEIVSKPLAKQLKDISCYAGATIMGDGGVALILDVVGLAQGAELISEAVNKLQFEAESKVNLTVQESISLLLVEIQGGDRLAVPVSEITQLQRFSKDAVEQVGQQKVVQYRGEILPLLDLGAQLPEKPDGSLLDAESTVNTLNVLIYMFNDRGIGFVVRRIMDVVEAQLPLPGRPSWEASIGSVVIGNQIVDVIDLLRLIRMADPAFFDEPVAITDSCLA